jgi:hypothetical protein
MSNYSKKKGAFNRTSQVSTEQDLYIPFTCIYVYENKLTNFCKSMSMERIFTLLLSLVDLVYMLLPKSYLTPPFPRLYN